jgi:hypothetical protein
LTTTPNTNLTGRLGRWSASHWKTATFGWLLFVIVAFMVGNAVTRHMLDPQKAGSGESGHVDAVLADEWKQPKSEAVIVEAKHGTSSDPQFRAAVDDLIVHLRAMKQVAKVQSPYASGYEGLRSKDGRTVLVSIDLRETDLAEAQKSVIPVQHEVDRVARAHPDAEFNQFGDASSEKEVNDAISKDLEKAGVLSLPVTLAVLLITFGALVAAGLPLMLGLSAVFATMGLLALPSGIVPLDPQAGVIVLLIGLAVGVDYSMFYVKRADEEHRAGRSRREAVEIAAATSGRAVLISGLTVTGDGGHAVHRRQDVHELRRGSRTRGDCRRARIADGVAGAARAARRHHRPDPTSADAAPALRQRTHVERHPQARAAAPRHLGDARGGRAGRAGDSGGADAFRQAGAEHAASAAQGEHRVRQDAHRIPLGQRCNARAGDGEV